MLTIEEDKVVAKESIFRFNTEQYFEMIRTGIIREGAPYELLDGILVLKDRGERGGALMSIGWMHNLLVTLFSYFNSELPTYGCFIQTQGPLLLGEDQAPEPDAAIIKGTPLDYERVPGAADTLCVVEVADRSLSNDRTRKQRIYAAAGIPQYVLINLVDTQIEVFEHPDTAAAIYQSHVILKKGQTLSFHVGDGKSYEVPVARLLPK